MAKKTENTFQKNLTAVAEALKGLLASLLALALPTAKAVGKEEVATAAATALTDLVDEALASMATATNEMEAVAALKAAKRPLLAKVAAIASQFGKTVKVEELEAFFARTLKDEPYVTELAERDARIAQLEAQLAAATAIPATPAAAAAPLTPKAAIARLKSVTESLTTVVEGLVVQGELSDKSADLQAEVRAFVRAAGVGEMETAPPVPAGMTLEDLPRVIGDFAHVKGADPLLKKAAGAAKALVASLARDAAKAAKDAAKAAKEDAAARKAGLPVWAELLGFREAPKAAAA